MGGTSSTTQTTSSNQTERQDYNLPTNIQQGSQAAVRGALRRALGTPYRNYDGQRIADLSDNERMGITAARRNYGAFSDDYDQAREYAGSTGSVFDQGAYTGDLDSARQALETSRGSVMDEGGFAGDLDSARGYIRGVGSVSDTGALDGYMNPYIDEVLRPQQRRRNEAFESGRAEMQRTAGMRGAFGGRQGLREAALREDHEQGMDELYGQAYAGAFDRATSLHQAEQDRKLNQASAFTNIAGLTASQMQREKDRALSRAGGYTNIAGMNASQFQTEQDRKLQQAGVFSDVATRESSTNRAALRDLMASGMTERTRDQAELDFQYLEHLEERDWDINNIGSLVQVLASVPHEYSTTGRSSGTSTTHAEQKTSPLQTIAGIGSIAAGAIMTGGASLAEGGTFWGGVGSALLDVGASSTGSG